MDPQSIRPDKGKQIMIIEDQDSSWPDKGKQIMITKDSEVHSPVSYEEDWDTDDELEMQFFQAFDDQGVAYEHDSPVDCFDHASSTGSSSYNPNKVDHFMSMGFSEKMVVQAIKENGEDNDEAILNSLLTYSVLENSPGEDISSSSKSKSPVDINEDFLDGFSDSDSDCGDAEGSGRNSDDPKEKTIALMVDMGYNLEDVLISLQRCGHDASVEELADYISAAEVAKVADATEFPDRIRTVQRFQAEKKRKIPQLSSQKPKKRPEKPLVRKFSKQMVGFGLPGCPPVVSHRYLPDEAVGPPYFYYENVALTPVGVWEHISRFLYDIQPEFVDSIHFSAAARKRGYIHNLPIMNRKPLLPIPPKTIHEAIPDTATWWPSWDTRTKLNCLLTCIGSAQLTERIRNKVKSGHPSDDDIKFVIEQCKKWNLVWVGKNRVAVLEPEDMEMLLGFPKCYTRGVSRTDRYKALGNSFQIDTVAYHLSVLKPMYPNGMNVLSLFSGIGGAEIALHKLGIPLNNVVSVEISSVNRKIVNQWWEETEQKGRLIHVADVRKINNSTIDGWIDELNGFDLVIGGSPCNNLAGGNRRTRDGLEGEHSCLFYEYYRILDYVRTAMKRRAAASCRFD
ncbi:DNA (cytosine-5)-methyltransferase DRM2 [Spinacia oleracea]|uniref:DNA (cytosine-5-)-methyltransferase n=1 Tax=Spinacia oleracea TaxID=3562 RepID=A0ABM3QII8_SPIOL|nr:DNA (cytosine-5)-methyltransferase DRM2-like [Spinacia oleracea]XP_056683178.1 DNA (cytosine-5)-methyltransferase DRM2-like [Spinacia oleracea]